MEGKSNWLMVKPLLAQEPQRTLGRKRLTVSLGQACPIPPRLCGCRRQGGS